MARDSKKMYKKTETALKMMAIGETARAALETVNDKKNVSRGAVYDLKQKYKKWSLTQPNVVKLAHSQVKRILKAEPRQVTRYKMEQGRPVVDSVQEVAPSDTNILAAAVMVFDRYEPVVQHSIQAKIDILAHPVDLSLYSRPEVLDVDEVGVIDMVKDSPVDNPVDKSLPANTSTSKSLI